MRPLLFSILSPVPTNLEAIPTRHGRYDGIIEPSSSSFSVSPP